MGKGIIKAPAWIKRVVAFSLGLHGIMHIVEFGSAMYESAYITASLAAFGSLTMILGALLLDPEERERHHRH